MSHVRSWLAARRPAAHMDLGPWLQADAEWRAGSTSVEGGAAYDLSMTDRMTRPGVAAIGEAKARPGRVRDSAFQLLAGDALLTYACEAALEEPDPEAALHGILARTASVR